MDLIKMIPSLCFWIKTTNETHGQQFVWYDSNYIKEYLQLRKLVLTDVKNVSEGKNEKLMITYDRWQTVSFLFLKMKENIDFLPI